LLSNKLDIIGLDDNFIVFSGLFFEVDRFDDCWNENLVDCFYILGGFVVNKYVLNFFRLRRNADDRIVDFTMIQLFDCDAFNSHSFFKCILD